MHGIGNAETTCGLHSGKFWQVRETGHFTRGVTSNLVQRVWQHREHLADGFTDRYGVTKLVWYELHESMESAIVREKRIKKWNRAWKIQLIEEGNPEWQDLWHAILG